MSPVAIALRIVTHETLLLLELLEELSEVSDIKQRIYNLPFTIQTIYNLLFTIYHFK